MNHSLDRELRTEVLSGAGDVAWGPLSPTSWAHSPEVENMYPYDPEKARELLFEAGYPEGLSFIAAMIDHPFYTRMAQARTGHARRLGHRGRAGHHDGRRDQQRPVLRQEYDAAITADAGSTDPALTLERKYTSDGSANSSGQTAESLEELLAEGARLIDPEERAPIYQEAEPWSCRR